MTTCLPALRIASTTPSCTRYGLIGTNEIAPLSTTKCLSPVRMHLIMPLSRNRPGSAKLTMPGYNGPSSPILAASSSRERPVAARRRLKVEDDRLAHIHRQRHRSCGLQASVDYSQHSDQRPRRSHHVYF